MKEAYWLHYKPVSEASQYDLLTNTEFQMLSPRWSSINRAYAGLRHAIVITTKPRFVVKGTCNMEVRLGGNNNSVT